MSQYRIVVYQCGKTGGEAAEAKRAHTVLSGLAGLDEALGGWTIHPTDLHPRLPIASLEDCILALERGRVDWVTGDETRTSYVVKAQSGGGDGEASVEITLGVDPHDEVPVFLPNRVDLSIEVEVGFKWPPPELVAAALEVLATALDADFGHAGSQGFPCIEEPLFGDGTPPVGWMTYLGGRAALPQSLPAPAVARPTANGGTILVAHAKPFSDERREQREAIDRLEAALRAAGTLRPVNQW